MQPPVAISRILRRSFILTEYHYSLHYRKSNEHNYELPASTYVIIQRYRMLYKHCTLCGPVAGTSFLSRRSSKNNAPGPGTGKGRNMPAIWKLVETTDVGTCSYHFRATDSILSMAC